MQIRVKLYGAYRQQLGQREMEIELADGATVRSLIENLGIADTVDLWVLLNDVPVERDRRLSAGDTVSLFQPIAGGWRHGATC